MPEEVVDHLTRLVLVDAVYFKGNWFKQFKEADTSDAQFKLNKVPTSLTKTTYCSNVCALNM